MARTLSSLLALLLLAAAPAVAKSKTAAAVAAANAAKADFHARSSASYRGAPEGMGAPNRTLKAVIAVIEPEGALVLESGRGEWLGRIDPRAIPELIAQDRARFGGRRHLDAADLEVGQRLKITFRGASTEIVKAKVLKDKSSRAGG